MFSTNFFLNESVNLFTGLLELVRSSTMVATMSYARFKFLGIHIVTSILEFFHRILFSGITFLEYKDILYTLHIGNATILGAISF